MPLANEYCKQVKREILLHATWPPSRAVRIGDFGWLGSGVFDHIANVRDRFGVEIAVRNDDTAKAHYQMSSSKGLTVQFHSAGAVVGGQIQLAHAGMSLQFTRKHSVFVNAAGCAMSEAADRSALGQHVLSLWREGQWKAKWAIVTGVVCAAQTTIAVSNSANSSLCLEAEGVPTLNLADASVGLRAVYAKDLSLTVTGASGMTPFIVLSAIDKSPFRSPEFRLANEAGRSDEQASFIELPALTDDW